MKHVVLDIRALTNIDVNLCEDVCMFASLDLFDLLPHREIIPLLFFCQQQVKIPCLQHKAMGMAYIMSLGTIKLRVGPMVVMTSIECPCHFMTLLFQSSTAKMGA